MPSFNDFQSMPVAYDSRNPQGQRVVWDTIDPETRVTAYYNALQIDLDDDSWPLMVTPGVDYAVYLIVAGKHYLKGYAVKSPITQQEATLNNYEFLWEWEAYNECGYYLGVSESIKGAMYRIHKERND